MITEAIVKKSHRITVHLDESMTLPLVLVDKRRSIADPVDERALPRSRCSSWRGAPGGGGRRLFRGFVLHPHLRRFRPILTGRTLRRRSVDCLSRLHVASATAAGTHVHGANWLRGLHGGLRRGWEVRWIPLRSGSERVLRRLNRHRWTLLSHVMRLAGRQHRSHHWSRDRSLKHNQRHYTPYSELFTQLHANIIQIGNMILKPRIPRTLL